MFRFFLSKLQQDSKPKLQDYKSKVYQFNNITELFHKKKDALALPKPGWDYQRCSGTKKKESVAFPKIKRLQGGQRKLLEFILWLVKIKLTDLTQSKSCPCWRCGIQRAQQNSSYSRDIGFNMEPNVMLIIHLKTEPAHTRLACWQSKEQINNQFNSPMPLNG